MSADNGVIRMARKGKAKFAFGEDPPFEIDVREFWDEWFSVDHNLRDEKGDIPKESYMAYEQQKRAFVQTVVSGAYTNQIPGKDAPVLTRTEVDEFLARVREEVEKTRVFTEVRSPGPQQSQESSAIRFAQ